MKARPAVVCPSCGALNRPTWEYCARCNHSLEGAQPAEATPGAEPAEDGETRESSLPAQATAAAAALAVVALGVAAWRYAASAPAPAAVNPALFTIPTRPPQLPPAPTPAGPGAADFLEGQRLLAAGDLARAVEHLAAAAAARPNDAGYRDAYADALWKTGNHDAALLEHAEAARLDPQMQVRYARALDIVGRRAEAMREYEDFLAANPGAEVPREELGRLYYRTGDYAKAAPYLQEAVQRRPTDPVLQQELGYALEQAGRRKEATTVYREVLRRAPGASVTRTLLSENLVEQGRPDEALAVLREGLGMSPDTPMLHRQLGSVLERSGHTSEAVAEYRAYARLAPNAPDAKELAGRAAQLEALARKP